MKKIYIKGKYLPALILFTLLSIVGVLVVLFFLFIKIVIV